LLTNQDKIKIKIKELNENPDKWNETAESLINIEPFAPHENTFLTEAQRAVMTEQVSEKMAEILEILKIDKNDPNVQDTPMRIASMYVNEWMVGRYSDKPRIEAFPNKSESEALVAKRCKVQSLCSHHFAPFFTEANQEDSYCVVVYKPSDKLLGISKISRLVDWYARRPQLQENLTNMVRDDLVEVLGSEDVMVYMSNLIHTCEYTRGSTDQEASTSSIALGGVFNDASIQQMYMK
jgi:GTP cyclohydrolase IA